MARWLPSPTTRRIQPFDAIFTTPGLQARKLTQLNPGTISDHKVWLLKGTLSQA